MTALRYMAFFTLLFIVSKTGYVLALPDCNNHCYEENIWVYGTFDQFGVSYQALRFRNGEGGDDNACAIDYASATDSNPTLRKVVPLSDMWPPIADAHDGEFNWVCSFDGGFQSRVYKYFAGRVCNQANTPQQGVYWGGGSNFGETEVMTNVTVPVCFTTDG